MRADWLQRNEPGQTLYQIGSANRSNLCHLRRLAYRAGAASRGDNRSFGRFEAGVPERPIIWSLAGVRSTITWPKVRASEICSGRSLRGLRLCSSFRSKFRRKRFSVLLMCLLFRRPRDAVQSLATFLWDYLAVDKEGPPHRIGTGPYPRSVFFASTGTYNLGHTCNTWTAEALRVAGLPVTAAGVVFAGQVLDQLRPILAGSNS